MVYSSILYQTTPRNVYHKTEISQYRETITPYWLIFIAQSLTLDKEINVPCTYLKQGRMKG